MKNQTAFFIIFCLVVTSFILGAYGVFLNHFGQGQEHIAKIEKLEQEVAREKFKNTLLGHQVQDIQQTVAELMPKNTEIAKNIELKNFADAVRVPASDSGVDLSGVLFARGKSFFAEKRFDDAIRTFREMLDKYPLSKYTVEGRFFITESYYLKRDYKAALSSIDEMITLYPDNDLTGYALLRMGQISEYNNQMDEASEVYRAVQANFTNAKLIEQAKKSAANLEVGE